MRNIFTKFLSTFTIFALLALLVGPTFANAASLTTVSDTMTREAVSANSVHVIKFTSTSGVAATNTIAIVFPSTFTTTGLVITDLQICHGTTGVEDGTAVVTGGTACTSTDETIAASNGASTVWGAVVSGTTTITLTAPSGTFTHAITAGKIVTITIAAAHIVNPSSTATPNVTITTTSDSGSFTVPILDSDQVAVTAAVNESVTFNIKAGTTNAGSQPYSVPLGILSTAGATYSNGSSTNSIWINIGTNTSGGAIVTVQSANAALKSTSVGTDTIPSATATMAAATANYGLCVKSHTATTGTLNAVAPFASSCSYSATNSVGAVTTSPQTIVNTNSAAINVGVAEVVVNAENSATTPAHTDYGDTLTFIGTGTF